MSRSSQMLQPVATLFLCYVWLFALSACAPVLPRNVQADLTKVEYNASKEAAIPADGVGADKSDGGTKLKVTQDVKGLNSSSITGTGQAIVKRQTEEQNDDFAACSTDLIDTDFTEPEGCLFAGKKFRLCVVGQFKTSKCIKDENDYCEFCPVNTFMSDNNNCTTCRPCTQCGPNEQVASECTIHEDTVCEPRSPSTVPTCPPCPVTPAITVSEITQASTAQPDTTSVPQTSPSETHSPSPISACPECKCNCSDSCKNVPGFIIAPPCPERITLYVLAGIFVFFITVMLFLLVWGSYKYMDLEKEKDRLAKENLKLELQLQQKGTSVIQEKSNGNATTPAGCEQDPQEEIEMKERVNLDESGTSGNTSQSPLLSGDADAENTPVGGDTKERLVVKLPLTSATDEPLSLSSLEEPNLSSTLNDDEHPSMIPLLTEEEEEAENASSAGVDPPYDRPDLNRKTKSVKGRIESTTGKPNDPPPLPQRNKGLQRSWTVGSSPQQLGPPSVTVTATADVHNSGEDGYSSVDHPGRFENTAFEASMSLATLPSQARVGHMNPPEDNTGRTNSHTTEAEPTEIQPFLPQVSEQPSKTDQKNDKTRGIRKFFPGSGKKKSKSDTKQKPQNSNDVTTSQMSPEASSLTVHTPKKEPVNIEDLYAKVDKNRKKTPPSKPSADSKDKPTGLHVNTKSPEDNLDDPASGSIASPVPISIDPLSSDRPSVGTSPTSDLPDGQVALPQTDVNDNEQKPDAEKASAAGVVSMQSNKPKNSSNDVSGDSHQAGANSRTDHDALATTRNKEENADVSHPNRSVPSKPIDPQSSEMSSEKDSSAANRRASGDSAESKNASLKIPNEKTASDEDFDVVASHLTPNDLLALYRHLKLKDAQVKQAEYDCRGDSIHEKAVCVLQMWRKVNGRKATCNAIITALRSSKNNEKADLLEPVLIGSADSNSDIRESYI